MPYASNLERTGFVDQGFLIANPKLAKKLLEWSAPSVRHRSDDGGWLGNLRAYRAKSWRQAASQSDDHR